MAAEGCWKIGISGWESNLEQSWDSLEKKLFALQRKTLHLVAIRVEPLHKINTMKSMLRPKQLSHPTSMECRENFLIY